MVKLIITFLSLILLSAQQNAKPCTSEKHRAFDFWVGDWVVKDKDGNIQGYNRIDLILNDCVLLENWTGNSGGTGKSINFYNILHDRWEQKWIDGRGIPLEFIGVGKKDSILYTGSFKGRDGKTRPQKLTFSKINHNLVRQLWEQSSDDGKSWKIIFDGYYHRKK